MKEAIRQRLLTIFKAEHAEHLEVIRGFLEEAARSQPDAAALKEALRRAHSLKGAARAVAIESIERLAHHLESCLQKVQATELELGPELIRLIHQALDLSEDISQALSQQHAEPDSYPVLYALEDLLGLERTPRPEIIEQESAPQAAEPYAQQHQQIRISALRLENLLAGADRLQIETRAQSQVTALCRQWLQDFQGFSERLQQTQSELAGELQQELYTLQSLAQKTLVKQSQHAWQLEQEARFLQTDMQSIRLLAAQEVFQTFPKMLRELAQEQGKQISCQFKGFEIEADRAVLQALKDPLMHLLRNAVAHGIERPEQRTQLAKEEIGQICCQLSLEGKQLQIQIEDDGQGVDVAGIQARGQGQSWQQLIFEAGFSTNQQVDHLSGRGLGLSVVAEALKRLQGSYQVSHSALGGLCFVLKVPIQIASWHVLFFKLGKGQFGIPSTVVRDLLRIEADEIQELAGHQVLMLEEKPVSLYDLPGLLGYQPESDAKLSEKVLNVMLLQIAHQRLALTVDGFLSERELVIKDLSGPAAIPLYMGAGLALSGLPVPIFDPYELLSWLQAAPQLKIEQQAPHKVPSILIVDDSITTRTLEQSLLEMQGFKVLVAVNGLEALKCLYAQAVDLVVSDLQMPEMDGLELLSRMKQDPALAEIPVVILTSLYADEDRQRGLELGAAAYLVKQSFDQQELLEVIGQLL